VTLPVSDSVRGPRATGALVVFALFGLLLPRDAPAAGPDPTPTPSLAARADRAWEGMVRRQGGLALSGRWRIGTLAFKEETFRWADAKDVGRNLLFPAARIVSHQLVCRDPGDKATCFEWSFRTKDGETHVFRDGLAERGTASRTAEVFVFFAAILPDLPAETAAGAP